MTVLLGRSAGILAMIAGLASILAVGLAMSTGAVEVGIDLNAVTRHMIAWITAAGVFILLAGAGVLLPGRLQSELLRSLETLKTRSAELFRSNAELEREIEERKRMEEEKEQLATQLLQSQKRESIGALAGGVAHDFNNILSGIIGYTEIAKADLPEGSRSIEYLAQALKACDRAKDLVKQILAFSRQSELEIRPLKIQQTVKEALRMLRSSLPASIEINQNIAPDLPVVRADPTQIHQIIMNLCTNAAHAIEDEHGVIKVSLDQLQVEKNSVPQARQLPPGSYIRLRISDTGTGISSKVQDKIFDPYFTTKKVGEGTGLGLAVVYGIVKDYGGEIYVESGVGKGTTFTIHIPAEDDIEDPPGHAIRHPPLPCGREHILFVDDEPTIAMTGRQSLERLGYRVTIRQSSLEALELFRNAPDRFDLVVTDMTMPHMTGDELSKAMLLIRRDIPIIICTGYSKRISNETAREIGVRALVMKPLTQHELAHKIRQVLDRPE
ncbi:MAG: ATP-binding protein [Desulfatiglandaceae bacterium]